MGQAQEQKPGLLSAREQASLLLLVAFLGWVSTKGDLRRHVRQFLRLLANPVLWLPFLLMFAYISMEVWIGFQLDLWNVNLLTATLIWAVASAGVLLFKSATEANENPFFFHNTAAATLAPTAFVTFFMNLTTLGLLAELALQLFLVPVTVVSVAAHARTSREHKRVAHLCDGVLLVVGVCWCVYTGLHLHATWDRLDVALLLQKLALPIWLTAGLLPFLFTVNLYGAYERAFRIIDSQAHGLRDRWRARVAIVLTLHFRARDIAQLRHYWTRKLVDAQELGAARSTVREFERTLRDRERAITEDIGGLVRYAGIDGTDSEGRRLDQREFKETTKALRWLATCHMGHYRRRNRYDPELLALLGDGFARHGLANEHGIGMKVSEDGQAWFAYRRTITGWCFAIGAAGPPPDQWEYDGQDPPRGFPGRDPMWGERPFEDTVNRNWSWDY